MNQERERVCVYWLIVAIQMEWEIKDEIVQNKYDRIWESIIVHKIGRANE